MRVHRQLAAELDPSALDEGPTLSAFAEAHLLELLDHLEGEGVVDLGEVDVLRRDPHHLERAGRRAGEPELEDVVPRHDVVGGVGLPLGEPQELHRLLPEIPRALQARHHEGRTAIGLERAIEEPVRIRDHRRGQVVVHAERLAVHERVWVQLRVLALRHGDRAQVLGLGPEFVHVPAGNEGEPLHRRRQAEGEVEVAGVHAPGHGVRVLHDDLADAPAREPVPAARDQHMAREPRVDRHGRVGERCPRPRAAHVRGGLVFQVFDAEVHRQHLCDAEAVEGEDPVDVARAQPRVSDGRLARFELDPQGRVDGALGAAPVGSVTDSNDA